MSYTPFGEFMRIQRIKHHEVMLDTANMLGCMVSFVSSVENGRKKVPVSWAPIIIKHYNLDETEQRELYEAIEESSTQVKINLSSATTPKRRLALQFQRSFDSMDDETANMIFELLNNEEEYD